MSELLLLTSEERRQVYEEEQRRLVDARPLRPALATRGMLISALAAILIITAGGCLAIQGFRMHQLNQKLGEAIGRDLGLTETILKVESESAKMTYAEFFELCNQSLESRTNLIVELRGVYPGIDYGLKTRLVEYLSAQNELVRAKRDFYRKSMEHSSATDSYWEQIKQRPSSEYGWSYYRGSVQRVRGQMLEAARQTAASADEFLRIYESMAKQEMAIASEARSAGLRFDPIFQKHAPGNRKRVEDTKQGIRQLAKLFY